MTFRPHHCRMCGRTCCNDCSDKRAVDWNQHGEPKVDEHGVDITVDQAEEEQQPGEACIEVTRVCEYCEVKLDNPQIEKFYEMGRAWRRRDRQMDEKKLEWHENAVEELDNSIQREKDEMQKAETEYNKAKAALNQRIDTLMSDKGRIEGIMKTYQNKCTSKIIENQELDAQTEELENQRTQMMVAMDKAMQDFEETDRKKNDLIHKMQVMYGLEDARLYHNQQSLYAQQMEQDNRLAEEQAMPFAEDNPYAQPDPFETSAEAIRPGQAANGETADLELDFQVEQTDEEQYEEQATETTVIHHFDNPFKAD